MPGLDSYGYSARLRALTNSARRHLSLAFKLTFAQPEDTRMHCPFFKYDNQNQTAKLLSATT